MNIIRLIKYKFRKIQPIEWLVFANKRDSLIVIYLNKRYSEIYPNEIMYAHPDHTQLLEDRGLVVSDEDEIVYLTPQEAERGKDKLRYKTS